MPSSQPAEPPPTRPCVVGLTGGLASGKSSVARLLSEKGVPVIDADVVVHDLYSPGGKGAEAVARIFGSGVLDPQGGVDRGKLSGRVLRDPEMRLALERAIHPLVRHEFARWLDSLDDAPVAVVEAALLVETGSYRQYDLLMVVTCSIDQQLSRAVDRGVPEDKARHLIEAQLPLDAKCALADVVVDNGGATEDLEREVDRAWSEALRLCGEKRNSVTVYDL